MSRTRPASSSACLHQECGRSGFQRRLTHKESIRWLENLEQSTHLANPDRCVHIGDRESDIYELFCLADQQKTRFLVRTCVDRLAGTGNTTIARKMQREPIQGTLRVEVLDAQRQPIEVELQLRYSQMTVHPPIGKHQKYAPLSLTVIHAWERGQPVERKPICWKLLTNMPVHELDFRFGYACAQARQPK